MDGPLPKDALLKTAFNESCQMVGKFLATSEQNGLPVLTEAQAGLVHRFLMDAQVQVALNCAHFQAIGADMTEWLTLTKEDVDNQVREGFKETRALTMPNPKTPKRN